MGRRLTTFRLDTSTPAGGGGVEVGLAGGGNEPSGAARLAGVIKQLEELAPWYEDPEARAGHWVYFEAPFNTVMGRNAVLFLDTPAARSDVQERDGLSLLLHGSARLRRPRSRNSSCRYAAMTRPPPRPSRRPQFASNWVVSRSVRTTPSTPHDVPQSPCTTRRRP
ncbi:SAVMC3_10250 family protein [Streptomyces chartreusis]